MRELTRKLAVEIENIESWPKEFREEAVKNKQLLILYHQEYRRISILYEEDVLSRLYPPHNKYETEYRDLADSLQSILMEYNIVGYHCTRLTPREMRVIQTDGLKILTSELVQQRLNNVLEDGHLSEEEYSYLGGSDLIKESLDNQHGRRTGMIWFCPNRSSLRICSGVYRLFRLWGGEAVYRGHEEDDRILHVIRRVGTPCIVKCAVPFGDTGPPYLSYAERFLSYLVSDVIEFPEPPAGFDMYLKRNLAPTKVLKIIDVSNPEFEQLTGYKSWNERYPIVNEI